MKKIYLSQAILLIFLSITLTNCTNGEETMFSKQPILSVKISAYLCKFDLRVNDVSVASNKRNIPTEVTIPINHWIQKGENEIRLIQNISEQESMEGSSCEVTLLVKENGAAKATAKAITNLKIEKGINKSLLKSKLSSKTLKASKNGEVISGEVNSKTDRNKLTLQRMISLPINLPQWKWLSSDKITDTKETRAILYNEYERVHKILENKNFSALGQLMSERLIELGSAFYMTPQEMAESSDFQSNASDPELELASLDPDIEIEIMGNSQLIKIMRWNSEPQIGYVYKDRSATILYHLIYRKSGNQWILTR